MKKETVVLIVVIAFLVGFISGATVAILRGTKGAEKTAMVQNPKWLCRAPQHLLPLLLVIPSKRLLRSKL
jgi:uncharacterized membrane protein